jgi:hypothetical protein
VVIKNHSGIVSRIKTWENSNEEFEMKTFGETGFLWHFHEDNSTTTLEKRRFYSPVYEKTQGGRQVRKSRHLFYILIPRDNSGDCVFVEIGPDGYVNRTYHDADQLSADIERGDLVPVDVISSADKPPEETISILKKYAE